MRNTGTDLVDGGISPEEAGILHDIGFDYVCVSSGGSGPAPRPAIAPGYQGPLAAAVKKAGGITVQAVGMIVDPHQAEAIVGDGYADWVALARGFLHDRRWAWHAAAALGAEAVYPSPYLRARPEHWPGLR
jgi:2,4-dienoyl-CoA reductase-like NADH-dependent reductase (Old Yellow Enzyme family)